MNSDQEPAQRLAQLVAEAGLTSLQLKENKQFIDYLALIQRWNARTNLTAIRDAEGILRRHFLESIACAQALPAGISTLLDYGSGAGFPGIPIAVCRPEIAATLAESQGKKAAFLQEAIRVTGISSRVHAGRAETLTALFDCVTLRAVDRMEAALGTAALLVAPGGWLAPLTTHTEASALQAAAGSGFTWADPIPLPGNGQGILLIGSRSPLPV